MLDVIEEELFQFSDRDVKRVSQIKVLVDDALVIMLAGTFRCNGQGCGNIELTTGHFDLFAPLLSCSAYTCTCTCTLKF